MEKIKELRIAKGMSQEELSTATGMSLRTIQRIEQGKVRPRPYSLKTIADALCTEISELHQQPESAVNDHPFSIRFNQALGFTLFYSVWATLVFLLALLNTSCQLLGGDFMKRQLFFEMIFRSSGRLSILVASSPYFVSINSTYAKSF